MTHPPQTKRRLTADERDERDIGRLIFKLDESLAFRTRMQIQINRLQDECAGLRSVLREFIAWSDEDGTGSMVRVRFSEVVARARALVKDAT